MNQQPGSPGLMQETTFNDALAAALALRRRDWRDNPDAVISERTGVVLNENRLRPDILVASPGAYPVVVEVEWGEPATADARQRLGKRVVGSDLPVRSAIAVGAPVEVRRWSSTCLEQKLLAGRISMRYAVLSANIRGDEPDRELSDADVTRWPLNGDVTGGIEDLACLCEYATAPAGLVSEMTSTVANRIIYIANNLHQKLSAETAHAIAVGLGQADQRQGIRLACCIWLTSLRLQNQLAVQSETLGQAGLMSVTRLRDAALGRRVTADAIRGEWDKILSVNYGAIFKTARVSLHPDIPEEASADALTALAGLSTEIASLRLGNRVDFAGELFPKLLEDREETAAHYTLPETAELLVGLAVERMDTPYWGDVAPVSQLRIADMACGTGSLLRAAYRHILRRHESAGGTAEGFHQTMMEQGITGLDINTLASHMTASGLSSYEIATEYHTSNIATAAVPGGQTGSLELLTSEQLTDVLGQTASDAAATEERPSIIAVPHNSQHLVIQNPPYLRARGGRKMFDVTGISELERKRSERRLQNIRSRIRREGDEFTDGQAGLGADFSALAHRKLLAGGVFATVLPLTAAHAESWVGFRRSIESEYQNIIAIAFTADEGAMMSADTYMNEMLLVATKRAEPKPETETASLLCVNLSIAPGSLAESYWLVKLIAEAAQSDSGNGVIFQGERIGSWTRTVTPEPGFPWFTLGMRNHDLAAATAELMQGRLYSPATRQRWDFSMAFTTLGQLADIGPTHHLIGHIRDAGEVIGAFTFDPISAGEIPAYPALWAADADSQTRITVRPTHSGQPASSKPDQDQNLHNMLAQRSNLFISRNLRMTSQAIAMAQTDAAVMGGRAWTSLQVGDDAVKGSLAIWCNSTLGLMLRVCYAQTTQPGRATMQINALAAFPVPNFAAHTPAGEHARAVALENIGELAALGLRPVSYAFVDDNRKRLDAIALDMMGLGGNAEVSQALDFLRGLWCREPAVHGGNRELLRMLGLRT